MATFCILLTLALQEFAKDEYKHKLKFGSCSACFRHETFRIRTCCICQYVKREDSKGAKVKKSNSISATAFHPTGPIGWSSQTMATPNFTMVFLDFEDSVTFVHGSCIVRLSFGCWGPGVLQRCRGYMEKALRRSRAWKNWRGREKKRVKDEAPGRPWPCGHGQCHGFGL